MSARSLSLRPMLAAFVACLLAAGALSHGVFEKPFFNEGKTNYATRGAAGPSATWLYMMQPQGYMTGIHDTIGWRFTMQDQEAATQENVELAFVRFAPDGRTPDTTPTGTVLKSQFRLFGFGMSGPTSYNFFITLGRPYELPPNVGIGIGIPAHASWPADGATMHGQLNLANDSRRPRVPPPHDKQVFAWEMPANATQPVPLGGRTLDVLDITGQYIEPVLRLFNRTSAYGLGYEDLYGPEAMHPVAARGDHLGVFVDGGFIGADGFAWIYVAPQLATTPIKLFPRKLFYLEVGGPWPHFAVMTPLDSLGQAKVGPMPFANVPAAFRSFWMQAVIMHPYSYEIEFTDAVRVDGL